MRVQVVGTLSPDTTNGKPEHRPHPSPRQVSLHATRVFIHRVAQQLSDPDRRTWLLAGDGGKGKTTVAYEFATRARPGLGEFGLCGTLWMSAKRRKFADGETLPTSSADFFDLETALNHILDRLGVGSDS
ncbi:MAG: hypothetical protein ACRDQW_18745 [Haloechinothrix sp.]